MRYWQPRKMKERPLVGIGVAAFLEESNPRGAAALKAMVASVQAQTYPEWRMHIVHDGPLPASLEPLAESLQKDPRVHFASTAVRKNQFGHNYREKTAQQLRAAGAEWLLLTNGDNLYMPVFLEWLLHEAMKSKALFAFCDAVHSHKMWKTMITAARYKHLDLGGFLAHRSLSGKVAFDKTDFAADGDYINRLVAAAAGRVVKVPAVLFTHN